jgi:hypothetical protein
MSAFHTDAAHLYPKGDRPLLIVDADEVLLRFAEGLDRFLEPRGCYIDFVSYRLHGNIKRRSDSTPLLDVEVTSLLDEFRENLDWLDPVAGSEAALGELSLFADIVVLSNVGASQAPARLRNLARLRFDFPLLVNSGPKGAAVRVLAGKAGTPVFFIDDIPQHLASVAELAPEVIRIHLIGDDRLKPLLPLSPHAHLRADNWDAARAFIRGHIAA